MTNTNHTAEVLTAGPLGLYLGDHGFFVAPTGHEADAEVQRVSPYYSSKPAGRMALREKAAEYAGYES